MAIVESFGILININEDKLHTLQDLEDLEGLEVLVDLEDGLWGLEKVLGLKSCDNLLTVGRLGTHVIGHEVKRPRTRSLPIRAY